MELKNRSLLWKIPISLLTARSVTSNDVMLFTKLVHDTVEFLTCSTPDFILPLLWPPNSPDLNPVDYEVWGVLPSNASTIAGFATSTT